MIIEMRIGVIAQLDAGGEPGFQQAYPERVGPAFAHELAFVHKTDGRYFQGFQGFDQAGSYLFQHVRLFFNCVERQIIDGYSDVAAGCGSVG